MIYNNDKDANNERDYSIDITINFSYCLGAKSEEDARAKVKELVLQVNIYRQFNRTIISSTSYCNDIYLLD